MKNQGMLAGIIVLAVSLLVQGCGDENLRRKNKQQAEAIVELDRQLQQVTANRDLWKEKAEKYGILHNVTEEKLSLEQQRIKDLEAQLAKVFGGIAKQNPDIELLPGGGIRFSGEVLFDSGKAAIKSTGKEDLKKVAAEFIGKDVHIRIDGHTDNDPIRVVKDKFPTNWHLSFARAKAVLDVLKESGIPERQMHIAAFGEFLPRVPNDSVANKRKNRRVEIRPVMPPQSGKTEDTASQK